MGDCGLIGSWLQDGPELQSGFGHTRTGRSLAPACGVGLRPVSGVKKALSHQKLSETRLCRLLKGPAERGDEMTRVCACQMRRTTCGLHLTCGGCRRRRCMTDGQEARDPCSDVSWETAYMRGAGQTRTRRMYTVYVHRVSSTGEASPT